MELIGQGFKLRGWRKEDAESLQKHADNTRVADFLLDRFPSPYTMDDAIGWIDFQLPQKPMLNFVIDVDGSLAGVIGLETKEDVYRKTAAIGYWLGEDYWGRGIMLAAIQIITDYAFTHLNIIRVQAMVFSKNPKSMRVLEKAGFVKEGILKNAIVKNGVILDEHVYALVKA